MTRPLIYSEPLWQAKSHDLERELLRRQSQHRQQECLADALHTGLHLPLADLVNAGDVIDDALDGKRVILLAKGRLVNLGCGTGQWCRGCISTP